MLLNLLDQLPLNVLVKITRLYCNTLQHTATWCSILQHSTTRWNTLQYTATHNGFDCNTQRLWKRSKFTNVVSCSVFKCVSACCGVLQRVVACCSVFQCVALCCSVRQCVAVCCSVLQCVACSSWRSGSKARRQPCTGWQRPIGCLSCRSFFAKEPLITGLFCGKRHIKKRHPMTLHHPVLYIKKKKRKSQERSFQNVHLNTALISRYRAIKRYVFIWDIYSYIFIYISIYI